MKTIYGKGDNGHKATTSYDLDNGLTLKVSTRKGNSGKLITTASCAKVSRDNGFVSETHRVYQDFYTTVFAQIARCTEKAIKAQHDTVVSDLFDHIVQEALNHYNTPAYIAKYGKQTETA